MTTHGLPGLTAAFVLTLAAAASIAFADGDKPVPKPPVPKPPAPSPDLSPAQVVKAVVAALKANDATDAGIRTTFAFASPGNQQATGPIERFIPLVKNPAYAPLLNHKASIVREVAIKGDQAAELVTITDAAGHTAYYLFQLSRQFDDGPLKGCWMTDGVMRVEPKADPGHTA